MLSDVLRQAFFGDSLAEHLEDFANAFKCQNHGNGLPIYGLNVKLVAIKIHILKGRLRHFVSRGAVRTIDTPRADCQS